ncbi:DNA adenine methylase [Anaerobacillus isosaccharinicus]|uniref:site-specific DNA-methyltransferase (adenine-specific) n=1 Tax=Anaerobacillus isosaccharinicus TaxID=1532552 RepID=A0A1S2M8K4_9BACI|nr:DNA adenine methylase [Anaerobacillus isosaccharinicus]MBA5586749.1 DNA adenine methylase [Anaerobacillus isosaccharinicus]QOY35029.1 DNA adenine methylase [Anaerobacillus isosaccharinicus]
MVKPFVKWPGGKTTELEIIHRYMPEKMNNYIEPFLGGGACFFSLKKEQYEQAFVNDFSSELISLYKLIKEKNPLFHQYLHEIWGLWSYFGTFSDQHFQQLRILYGRYKDEELTKEALKIEVEQFAKAKRIEIETRTPASLNINADRLIKELITSVVSKFDNTKKNELKKGDLPEVDYQKNVEASIRATVYTYYRYIYNERDKYKIDHELHIALFFYLREFCYSSMFRYNSSGGFNVPYGGASYNSKAFINKIDFLRTTELQEILQQTLIYNLDFEQFFKSITLQEGDFIFLDPPYDSDFSTYANNSFGSSDQERLAHYLLNNCPCKFMLIIKNTDFIYQLYNKPGINIIGFDKAYSVSFMDRNDKKVEHILITNY